MYRIILTKRYYILLGILLGFAFWQNLAFASHYKTTKKFSGHLLSLNFQKVPVRRALQLLAQFAKVNLVVSDKVTGDITLRLENLPWDQALDIIMRSQGLSDEKMGNAYIIAPAEVIAAREKKFQVSQPLQSELIQINYGKATQIATMLKHQSSSLLSVRGVVSVDTRTNTLWIQDTPSKLAIIHKLIKQLDAPIPQVLIQARIVNIDKKYEHELGIRWGITKPGNLSGTLEGLNEMANDTPATPGDFTKRLNVDLPAVGVGKAWGAGSIGIALAKLGGGVLLDLELSALQVNGNAKIIASPRLITANGKEAMIMSGEEIPYQEATLSGATAVAFKKAVLSLKVTPQITPDNHIILDLQVNQDKRGAEVVLGVPSIDTREIKTQVLAKNGQTIVLGGIFQKTSNNNIEKIPLLGDIPVIGYLFKHTKKEVKQSELLIFITPRIIFGTQTKTP